MGLRKMPRTARWQVVGDVKEEEDEEGVAEEGRKEGTKDKFELQSIER